MDIKLIRRIRQKNNNRINYIKPVAQAYNYWYNTITVQLYQHSSRRYGTIVSELYHTFWYICFRIVSEGMIQLLYYNE